MHLTKIKTRDGKEYRGIIEAVKIERDPPYIQLDIGNKTKKILLFEIISAITKNERVAAKRDTNGVLYPVIKDMEELPRWLDLYKKWAEKQKA